MKIVKTKAFQNSLKEILHFISLDNKNNALKFANDLNKKIDNLNDFPFMYRVSIYFNDEAIRDLIYKGYVIAYKVDTKKDIIVVLGITKYRDKI